MRHQARSSSGEATASATAAADGTAAWLRLRFLGGVSLLASGDGHGGGAVTSSRAAAALLLLQKKDLIRNKRL